MPLQYNRSPHFAAPIMTTPNGFALERDGPLLTVWSNRPSLAGQPGFCDEFDVKAGDEIWIVLGPGEIPAEWTVDRARDALGATVKYWRDWSEHLRFHGIRADRVKQSALLVHLLSYAPTGAPVAAPTVSLPERIGGGRNYDYRYAWVRDASLSLSLLSELGFTGDDERYLDWLAQLPPGQNMPLQTVYRVNGDTEAPLRQRDDINGYREFAPGPVRQSCVPHARNRVVRVPGGLRMDLCRARRQVEGGVLASDAPHCRFRGRALAGTRLRHLGAGAAPLRQQSRPVMDGSRSRDQDRRAGRPRRRSGDGLARGDGRDPCRDHGTRLERRNEFVPAALRRRYGRTPRCC